MSARFVDGIEVLSRLPAGPARPVPLLFIHGAFAGAWVWDEYLLPYFAERGYAAHALSLRGHGQSRDRDRIDWLSIHDYVDDVRAVIADLGEAPALIGHSMGGFVVQKYLEQHPVPAAVLLASVPPQGLLASSFGLMFKKPQLLLDINRLLGGANVPPEVLREALFAQDIPLDDLKRYYRLMQPESQRAMWDMSMFNLPQLHKMTLPPLLVLGAENDALIPPALVQATARTYGVADKIFRNLGHGMILEPDWRHVADTIADWLDSLTR